ncbi:MAG TPA: calcium/sodium antiporter [Candidatus Magasanikbacteria bacterium]|jgi:cation:H+ antiporter|nr:calcium/sodium antiporter [Candidatus Magasanikbacteria bacterium]HQF57457.1 calcium/sodium antiporter [Candidatus Magasanikbacteria bacterium]HQL52584.1 calcium/sodium antiporter [Candidatus Magasanikbacteria bacterium]
MLIPILLIILGLGILILGAEGLVRGSASMAKKWGVSSLVIGLTIVAFGTSTPELVVNMFSAVRGSTDIAIGNIVGSNISNILLILGISAIVYPLSVKKSTVTREIPFALLGMILVFTMGNDMFFDGTGFNAITRTDGFSLMAIFIIFLFYIFGLAKKGEVEEEEVKVYSWPKSILFTIAGLALLVLGGQLLVDNAIILARLAGLSEALIGLTIVAIGTSLPELATSVVAAYHKHDDIAIGNIVGSNIFNVFWILGLTGTMLQMPFNPNVNIDVLVGIGATVLLFIFMFIGTKRKLNRWQGVMFLLLYIAYTFYLINRG